MKCKYYSSALCLTDDTAKCEVVYNEHNDKCPYYKIYLKELI